jgi:hypothetical protein
MNQQARGCQSDKALSVAHFSLRTGKSNGAAVPPEAEGTLVRVRSEGEMAAPCGFSIWTEKLYDGQDKVEILPEFWYFVPAMKRVPGAKILTKQSWGDFRLFRFETPAQAAAARPGQFVMIRVAETPYPLLRRPISLHAKEGGALEIFFKIAGEGTALLAEKNVGETLDVLGPLGSGFNLSEDMRGKTAFSSGAAAESRRSIFSAGSFKPRARPFGYCTEDGRPTNCPSGKNSRPPASIRFAPLTTVPSVFPASLPASSNPKSKTNGPIDFSSADRTQ